jgi:hypothetical protein
MCFIKHHAMQTYGGVEVQVSTSWSRHQMELSGKLHAGKGTAELSVQLTPKPTRCLWEEKYCRCRETNSHSVLVKRRRNDRVAAYYWMRRRVVWQIFIIVTKEFSMSRFLRKCWIDSSSLRDVISMRFDSVTVKVLKGETSFNVIK